MLSKFPFHSIFSKNLEWLEQKQSNILSAAVIITVANIISSVSGLIRQRLLLSHFFDTDASQKAYEAFQIAFQIPDMLFQLVVIGALSAAFIPLFAKLRKEDEKLAFEMSSVILNIILLIFIVLGVIIFIASPFISNYRTGDQFTPEQVEIVTRMTRIMLVGQLFFAISSVFGAVLQSYQRFIIPSIAPIIYNLGIVLGTYLFSERFGIYSAGIGVVIGAFLHMIIQLPSILRLGFKFKLSFNINVPGVKQLFRLIPPRVLTIGVNEFQNLSLGFFATSLGNLSFVVIKLALSLMTIPIRLFGVPIGQASLPFLSEESHERDLQHFKRLLLQSINQIAFLAFPASVLLLILRIPIVRLVFGTANFPWDKTLMTGRAVAIISISVAAQAMVQILVRAFYALRDTRTPFYITLITVFIYLVGSALVVFYTPWGIYGLAMMTSIAAIFELLLSLGYLHKKIGGFLTSEFWIPQAKMLLASFLMAVFLYLPFRIFDELIFDTTRIIELIGLTITTGTIGVVVYLYFATLFEIKELEVFKNLIFSFTSSQRNLSKSPEVVVETPGENTQV
jgi:putative peptidoglycan lipid II flippase